MHILHVIQGIDRGCGGPSHALRGLAREQVRRGHRVSLLATNIQFTEPWEEIETYRRRIAADPAFAGAEVYLGVAYGRRPPWSVYGYSPECRRWLRRRLSDPAAIPDVIHIHGVFSHLTSLAAAGARRRRIPYIIRPAGSLDSSCFRMGRATLKRAFAHLFLHKDMDRAAGIHVTSEHEAREMRAWVPAERIHLIPHGVEVPSCSGEAASQDLLEAFPHLRGKRIVLFLGRVAAKKRPELLLDAVARLRAEFPDLVLLIAGNDAGHMPALQAAVEECGLSDAVIFTGFLEGSLKEGALAVSDIFALPSLDENFGVAVVEALAHGAPALVTPGVGSHTYVDASGCGLTVEDDVPSIAAGMRKLLAADRRVLGLQGRRYVEQHLSWAKVGDDIDTLYAKATSRRGK